MGKIQKLTLFLKGVKTCDFLSDKTYTYNKKKTLGKDFQNLLLLKGKLYTLSSMYI